MNKKVLFVCGLMLCTLSMFAAKYDGPKGAHPWKTEENANGIAPKFAHWTIALDGGFNSFDGDFGSEMKHPVWLPAAGLALEYNFTPMWTLGIGGFYDWYKVTGKNDDQHAAVLLDGMMARAQAYLAFDLMAACYPKAKKKIFGLDLLVGGGAGWFKNSKYYPDEYKNHTASYEPMSDSKFSSAYPFVQAGVLFDFNLGRVTSLGIKGTYSYYIKDIIDGRGSSTPASKNNDGIIDVSLNLRFKLVSRKKTHVKNIASYDAASKYNELSELRQKDTLVLSHVDTLYISTAAVATNTVQVVNDNFVYVYFDHNSNSLNDAALVVVQQLASQMKWDSTLCAEIIGYADNTGTEEHNSNLGVARAQNIRDELVEEHNIDPSRITYSGGGAIHGGRSTGAYTPNRRADIRIMQCDDFGAVKRRNDDRDALAAQAQQQAMAERDEKNMITAPEGMTLSAISRKYYGNTYCWVFIYEANKGTLKTPNYIPQGTKLVIPDLTAEQKHISKNKADAYYEKLK
mgnify:CR=1 FL=1